MLKDYLIEGFAINNKRMLALNKTIEIQNKMSDNTLDVETNELKCIIDLYNNALTLLDNYYHHCVSKLMGYSNRSTINKIESGAHNIDREKILKFAYMLKVPAGYLLTGEKNYKTNRMILTTIEDCVYSCELTEDQMQIAQDLMHIFMKENELKEKTKKLLDKACKEE